MKISLRSLPGPAIAPADEVPAIPQEEYERRLRTLTAAANSDWVLVYGDREHAANLTYLINFDPRFEEALLVLGVDGGRTLIVGNEGLGYTSVLPLPVDVVLCQSFSLNGQARDSAPRLDTVLKKIGIGPSQSASLVGWKYLEPEESENHTAPAFVPSVITDTLRGLLAPKGRLVDGSHLLMHPQHGLRSVNSADQIAQFEAAARDCSFAVFNMIEHIHPGMREVEAARYLAYAGRPLSMHPIFTSGKTELNGLRSAGYRQIQHGDAVATAVGYWGSLVCRAGLLLDRVDESFFERVVVPYFRAVATWYQSVGIGAQGDEVYGRVAGAFGESGLRSALNPGHLISYDEWLHSPFRPGSADRLRSGMVLQCDIIPAPMEPGEALNCEDTIALADEALRAQIRAAYPAMWGRIQERRRHITGDLGIEIGPEVLPLTDSAAHLPPFWLIPERVCALEH